MVRLVALFLLLPGAFALERLAYYGMRSVLYLHMMRGLGSSTDSIGRVLGATSIATTLTVFVGAALCIVIRPSIVLAVGSGIGVLAYALLALGKNETLVWVALMVLALGQGLLKPAAFALAASELPFPREHLRSALMVLLYGATNLSALAGSSGSGAIAAHTGESVSFALATGLAVVGAVLTVGVVVVDFVTRRLDAELGPPVGRVVAGAAILLACALPYYAAMGAAGSYQFEVLQSAGAASSSFGRIYALNPIAVLLTSGVLCAALLLLHVTKVRLSSLFGIGAGLSLFALGSTPLLLASGSPASAITWVSVAAVGMALGEACVGPLLLSRVVGDIPRRFAGVAAAVVLAVSYGVTSVADAVARPWPAASGVLLALSVVVCLVLGVTLSALTPLLVRKLYTPAPPEPAP